MATETSPEAIYQRCRALVQHYNRRDHETVLVRAIRRGDWEQVAPDAFTEDYPGPIIANRIDTMARDAAATLSPLPSFNCLPSSTLNDRSKEFAEKRTKIANGYVINSQLQAQMPDGVDSYNGYGMFVGEVRPDFATKSPKIKLLDGGFAYPLWDADFNVTEILLVSYMSEQQIRAYYPDQVDALRQRRHDAPGAWRERIKVHRYQNKVKNVVYLPDDGCLLEDIPNPMGKCTYVAVPRPMGEDWFAVPRGAYVDLVYPLLAANEFRLLGLEGVAKAVQAPVVVPTDVAEVPYGPDATIHTANPQGVQRLRVDIPQGAFQATEILDQDIQVGGMSPGSRSGNVNASVITGRGIDALGEGFSQQIALSQSRLAVGLEKLISLCFEMDEKFWPEVQKEIRGQSLDNPGRITYVPARHIKGDYSVVVDYGFLLGLDANRALVFILQAQAAGLISNDTAARNLPVKINLAEEANRIQLEQLRNGLVAAIGATTQAIPQMLAGGMPPTDILSKLSAVIDGVKSGDPIEAVVAEVFAPPPPTPPALGGPGPGQTIAEPGTQDAINPATGAPDPNARPDLQSLIAGLSGSGRPNLQAGVMRQLPTAGA